MLNRIVAFATFACLLVALAPAAQAALTWDGGAGLWTDPMWNTGNPPTASEDMDINGDTGDSVVTVAADFVDDSGPGPGSGDGPAASVFVGEDYDAKLVVAGGVTLEVTGATTAGEFGKIAVENGAILQTSTATIEIDGRYIAGVQGNDAVGNAESGLLQSTGQLALEEFDDGATLYGGRDAIQIDWIEGADATSMFGGVYVVATYTGTALTTAGETTNLDGNIGAAYIKSVVYDVAVDLGNPPTLFAIDVELHPQVFGDVNLDGDVNAVDRDILLGAWDPTGANDNTWFDGDMNFDGRVDSHDLAMIPEPSTLILLATGALGLLLHIRRKR